MIVTATIRRENGFMFIYEWGETVRERERESENRRERENKNRKEHEENSEICVCRRHMKKNEQTIS